VDMTAGDFKLLKISEMSDVWITFTPESCVSLQGTG
jgi:hypothetical protein